MSSFTYVKERRLGVKQTSVCASELEEKRVEPGDAPIKVQHLSGCVRLLIGVNVNLLDNW